MTESERSLYDPLPNGNLCWATFWKDPTRFGWWVQHGAETEARRFLPLAEVYPMSSEELTAMIWDWVREAHEYRPCKPKKLVSPGVVGFA